jgi:hypothetical protein
MKAGASSDYTLYTTQGVNQFSIYDNVASADRLTISSSGNVGISTTTPAAKLHIAVADAAVDGTKGVRITNPAGTIVVLECGVSSDSFVGTTSGSDFSIRSNNIERLKFPNAGGVQAVTTISVGNATPSASGAGITFPATQSASSNANTLDDYEEGTWTPVDNSGASITFDVAYGYYIKVGKVVYVQAKIVYPSTASGLNNSVGGLPFSMSNTNPYNFPVGATTANGNTSANRAYGFGSSFSFVNTADSISTNSALSSANINFNLTYIADQ